MKSEMSDSTKALGKAIAPLRRKEELAAIKTTKDHLAKELSDHYRILGAELRIDDARFPSFKCRV